MAVLNGIAFPFGKGTQSFPKKSNDNDLIRENLIQLILTGTGERVMRPSFGTDATRFIFEPNSQVLSSLIQTEISSVITKYEPRVTLRGIAVRRIEAEVTVTIQYVVNLTRQAGTVEVSLGQASL